MGNVERDANELPDGQWMTTQSFWINNKYILSQLNSNFIKQNLNPKYKFISN